MIGDRNDGRNDALSRADRVLEIEILDLKKKFLETCHARIGAGPKKIRVQSGQAADWPSPEPGTASVRTL